MLALVVVVIIGASVLLGDVISNRFRIPSPLLLLLIGVVTGFAPALREVHLPPEIMLLLILPALLYWESLNTSVREARANLRGIRPGSMAPMLMSSRCCGRNRRSGEGSP